MAGDLVPDRRDLRVSHDDRDGVVERLRVAAGDGRLTAEELDERVEAALTARTYGELDRLTTDLPATTGDGVPAPHPAGTKDLVQLRSDSGAIRREGSWAVPRRLELAAGSGSILLDFPAAVITAPALELTVTLRSGSLVLVVPDGVTVDLDDITLRSGAVRHRAPHSPGTPVRLAISVSGSLRSGSVVVRPPRRGLMARLRGDKQAG